MPKKVPKFKRESSPSWDNFANAIKRSSTLQSYSYSLDEFMRFHDFTDYDKLASVSNEQVQSLLEVWIKTQKTKRYKTVSVKLDAIELFFDMNRKLWYKKIIRKMLPDSDTIPGGDIPFTSEELWKMRCASRHPRDTFLVDLFASTGMRTGAIIDPVLKLKHVAEMSDGCMAIKIYDNSKEGYWAFLSPEATDSYNKYLRWRKYNQEESDDESPLLATMVRSVRKNNYMSPHSVRKVMIKLMKWAQIERTKTENRYDKAVVYGFRKRFNTILKIDSNVNSNIAEKLMAHKKGLDGAYLRPTREQCFTEFKKAIPELTMNPAERQRQQIQKLSEETTDLKCLLSQNKELSSDLSDVKEELEKMKQWREISVKYQK
jgi:integrase/recombinase XerD